MPRRWIQFHMPVLVCVEVPEEATSQGGDFLVEENSDRHGGTVTEVVMCDHADDLVMARGVDQCVNVYDDELTRISSTEPATRIALRTVTQLGDWPERRQWRGCWHIGHDMWSSAEIPDLCHDIDPLVGARLTRSAIARFRHTQGEPRERALVDIEVSGQDGPV